MSKLKSDLIPFLKQDEIQQMVTDLAKKIDQDYAGQSLVLICPLRGSIHFTADLARALKTPTEIDFVFVQSGGRGGSVKIIKDISLNIANRHVLVVEEIIDTGRTLSFLMSRLRSAEPASLRIVTLLDKPARRELPIRADYTGRTIEDRFVVGYGMDSGDLGRNYQDIYYLKN